MNKETFEQMAKESAKEMKGKKAPTRPETQYVKGALWAWSVLSAGHTVAEYEATLRQDVTDRLDHVEQWQESLITDTAKMMAERDDIESEIKETGRLLTKYDKNLQPYKESNPLYVHLKELQRSIGMQREHLGLSYKVNPMRMRQSPKKNDTDPRKKRIAQMLADATESMNDIPETEEQF